ncbi:AraC family transcriptional regulator [Paenibacillus daejeonensis]|uniref:AraC family transcriptional regulator n=1 Tax=Paenibacillus daejeonensis TaxID=135193 RepID=UPI000371D22B|nr:AraC family transcriptional regulator [Paenibacillus daejeonensis]
MDLNLFSVITDLERRLPIYITSAGGWTHQNSIERPSGYPSYQWLQVTSGSGVFSHHGKEIAVHPGQGILTMAHDPHEYRPTKAPWSVRWICFDGNRVQDMLEDLGIHQTGVFFLANPDALLKHHQESVSLLQAQHPATVLESSSTMYRLLLDLYRYISRSELRSRKHQMDALTPVLAYMEQNYNHSITLGELAELQGVTPQHICVLFQQALGARPIEYLTRIRMRKAKELLLQQPRKEVKAIAAQVGYEHPSYFIKLFKQQEGLTPVMFRSAYLSR